MGLNRFSFGSGRVFAVSNGGNQVASPTPMEAGTVQEATVEIATTMTELMGQNQFPEDVAPARRKITGKVKFAQNNSLVISNLIEGIASATGRERMAADEAGTVPGSVSYTVTVTNSANFKTDYGVKYAATGLPFTKVASSPAAGEYSVSAGVYTFASADANADVLISYSWTDTSTGTTVTATNQLQGYGPVFQLFLTEPYNGDSKDMFLYACRHTKITRDQKNGAYNVVEMDFEAYADAAGNVYKFMEG